MSASTSADFEKLIPTDAGLTFEVFGNTTQRDVDALKDELFPRKAVLQAQLQDLWVRHPNRQGEN